MNALDLVPSEVSCVTSISTDRKRRRKNTLRGWLRSAPRALTSSTLTQEGAGTCLSLTWLWTAEPKQEARQEKAEATQGSRWFHCCAWQVAPLNSHVQRRILPQQPERMNRLHLTAPQPTSLVTLFASEQVHTLLESSLSRRSMPSGLNCDWRESRKRSNRLTISSTPDPNKTSLPKLRKALYSCHYSPT